MKKIFIAFICVIICACCICCDTVKTNKNNTDYPSIVNQLTTYKIRANLTVNATAYSTFGPWVKDEQSWLGSGIVFAENEYYYYALTNNHVVYNETNYKKFNLSVTDYLGTTYRAEMLKADSAYDLALIRIRKSSNLLAVISLAETNPEIGDEIICVGQPGGQENAITFGKVQAYKPIKIGNASENQSNVTFPVMEHSAPTFSGNSGGAVFGLDLSLCGIHYAGSTDKDGNFIAGYAIPAEKIIEFINSTGVFKPVE